MNRRRRMENTIIGAGILILGMMAPTAAKEKDKPTLPQTVLEARTVVVIIDPDAGISMTDPGGNRTAQSDVEKALLKWGRYTVELTGVTADLVIVIRKSSGKAVEPTIGGVPTNDRPVVVHPTDSGIHIGVQQGHPPGDPQVDASNTKPAPGVQTAPMVDFFEVYFANGGNPPYGSPAWRYAAKNALKSPSVPAVDEFRKAVEESVKQQQQQKKKHPSSQP
jgi:hypothetical protein